MSRPTIAVAAEPVRKAVRHATALLVDNRASALDGLTDADAVRDEAAMLRRHTLDELGPVLAEWQRNAEANGIRVHMARDSQNAVDRVLDIARSHQARIIVKGKSMASEEIHLNDAIERAGITVVETDLGEFIIQLAHETPSHIIVPAIHKSRFDVADLFTADSGGAVAPVVADQAAYARQRLRAAFLAADIGITGANFAVAETGSICLVENEGNGRMCSSLPRVHIAIMGMERIVRDWAELDVMLSVLARSATGQALSVYTNIISGPRRAGEIDGPHELHVIVLDNGRSNLLGTEYQDTLACIRCGACLNVCPVYRHIGGHAYDSVYPGPIGAVLTPLLQPADAGAAELPHASTLCGACTDVCPVRIPLHDLLFRLRQSSTPSWAWRLWSRVWSSPTGYRLSIGAARIAGRAGRAIAAARWGRAWTRDRSFPRIGPR